MKRREWSPPRLTVRIHPIIYQHFKEICIREGDTISSKIRKWIIQYVAEHEKGNPQLRLDNLDLKPHSIVEELFEEKEDFMTPTVEARRKRLEILEFNLQRHPHQSTQVAIAFMKKTGLKARTVEGYMRVLGHPIELRPKRKPKRNY